MDEKIRTTDQCPLRETNDQLIYSCSKCVNCSNEVSATTYIESFKISGRVMSVLETLQIIFCSTRSLFMETIPATSVTASYKFCHTCGEIFGHILKLLVKFLKLTSSASMVSNITAREPVANVAKKYCDVDAFSNTNSVAASSEAEEDNIESSNNQMDCSQNAIFTENFNVKPVVSELRRSPRILEKSTSQVRSLSEHLGLTSGTMLFEQMKSEQNLECQLNTKGLKQKYGRKLAAIRLKKRKGNETAEKSFACTKCSKNFKENNRLLRHIQDKHPTDEDKSSPKTTPLFRCKICSVQTVSEVELDRHLGTHIGTIHERPFECNKCNRNYKEKRALVKHMRRAHPAEAEECCPRVRRARQSPVFTTEAQEWLKTALFKCAESPCGNIAFSSYSEWLIHQRDNHQLSSQYLNADISKIKFPPKGANAVQPCPRCGKRLSGKQQVVDHIRIVHLGEAVYACGTCGKTFSTKFSLEKHIQYLHANTPRMEYLCNVCGAQLKSQGSLSTHERTIHSSLVRKFYECEVCKMKFIFKHRLENHVAMVHSKTDGFRFFCDICGKGLKVKSQLRYHRSRHIKGASKDEVCELCGKAYSFKKPLKAHLMTVHKLSLDDARKVARIKIAAKPRARILPTGEVIAPKELKPVNVCIYCGRHCARRDLVFTHLMSAHGISEEAARSLTQLETKRKLVTGPGNVLVFQKIAQNTPSS